ncbi:MAG TPA: non-ribosomal peptide synthetase [Streptosporangiaceae bacterium]
MSGLAGLRIEQAFIDVAEKAPFRIAVADGEGDLTYGELLARSRRVAASLRRFGVRPGDAVLLVGDGRRETIIAMLGALMIGSHYVPVDPRFPAERARLMARLARATIALHVGEPPAYSLETATYSIDSLTTVGPCDVARRPAAGPDGVACVLFTSGTTGTPKPVGVTHRGIVGMALASGSLRLLPDDGMLLHSTLAFDMSTMEIWSPLLVGARVVPADHRPLAPHELATLLRRCDVTAAVLPPAVFQVMATHHAAALGALRLLVCGGDVLQAEAAAAFSHAYPGTLLVNGYGPTENATVSTFAVQASWDRAECDSFPIGKPVDGTRCYLLDDRLRPVRPGDIGTLFLGGDRLACGYLGQPIATAERFLPDPFCARPGARMYETGDLARQLPSGNLEFVGRTDDEVKVRGFRVNLAEASAILAADPAVHNAAVLAERAGTDGATLIGFITPAGTDVRALLERAKTRAPSHLLPQRIVPLTSFPLAATGKIDRGRMLSIAAELRQEGQANGRPVPSTVPGHSLLAESWMRHTGVPPLPASDFFADGGTSLGLMRLIEDIRMGMGVALDLADVYAAPSYADLYELVLSEQGRTVMNILLAERNPQ